MLPPGRFAIPPPASRSLFHPCFLFRTHRKQDRKGTDHYQPTLFINGVAHGKRPEDAFVELSGFGFQINVRLPELGVDAQPSVQFEQCREKLRTITALRGLVAQFPQPQENPLRIGNSIEEDGLRACDQLR